MAEVLTREEYDNALEQLRTSAIDSVQHATALQRIRAHDDALRRVVQQVGLERAYRRESMAEVQVRLDNAQREAVTARQERDATARDLHAAREEIAEVTTALDEARGALTAEEVTP